jgi:hypothetical protein
MARNLLALIPHDHQIKLSFYHLKEDETLYPTDMAALSRDDDGNIVLIRVAGGDFKYEIIRTDGTDQAAEDCVGLCLSTVGDDIDLYFEDPERTVLILDHGYGLAHAPSETTIDPQKPIKGWTNGHCEEIVAADDILSKRGRTITRLINGKLGVIFLGD